MSSRCIAPVGPAEQGTVYFMEWSHGLESWNGVMEWSTGMNSWSGTLNGSHSETCNKCITHINNGNKWLFITRTSLYICYTFCDGVRFPRDKFHHQNCVFCYTQKFQGSTPRFHSNTPLQSIHKMHSAAKQDIRKTCPCNEYPLKPHF